MKEHHIKKETKRHGPVNTPGRSEEFFSSVSFFLENLISEQTTTNVPHKRHRKRLSELKQFTLGTSSPNHRLARPRSQIQFEQFNAAERTKKNEERSRGARSSLDKSIKWYIKPPHAGGICFKPPSQTTLTTILSFLSIPVENGSLNTCVY